MHKSPLKYGELIDVLIAERTHPTAVCMSLAWSKHSPLDQTPTLAMEPTPCNLLDIVRRYILYC